MADSNVKVAVRVRPLVPNEITKGCKEIVETVPENEQTVIRSCDKTFTFNYVMGAQCSDNELYKRCVAPLLKNLFQGFNVTIFAYGQTGSGKTYFMGTNYNGEGASGVIPNAIKDIFEFIRDQFTIDFNVTVCFIELYREILYDLVACKPRDQCVLELRENLNKETYIPNLIEIPVNSVQEVLEILRKGSQGRSISLTNMKGFDILSIALVFSVSINMCTIIFHPFFLVKNPKSSEP